MPIAMHHSHFPHVLHVIHSFFPIPNLASRHCAPGAEPAPHYVRGSHRWGKVYAPASFSKDSGFADQYAKMGLEPCPDIEARRGEYDLLCESLATCWCITR